MSVCVSSEHMHVDSQHQFASGPIEIQSVQSRSALSEFIALPSRIFHNDPCWIEPLELETRQFLCEKHPFRLHGTADLLLARRGGEVVGRLLISDDPRYNAQHETNLGCFGMFHSIDDQSVANQLLDAGANWLRQRGRTKIIGPIDYSTNYSAGLLVEGFDTPPRVMMNHHPPYYTRLLEGWGFRKAKDLYAWWFDKATQTIDGAWRRTVNKLAQRFDVKVRPVRKNDFKSEIDRLHQLYNEAWEDNWGFVKMTSQEYYHLAQSLKKIAVPEMILIAEVQGRPVGMAITIPDLNEAAAPLKGRLTRFGIPIGLARLLYRLKRVKTVRLAVLGVTPDYRRRGVAEMLIQRTFDYGANVLGYNGAELSWTLEDNEMINRSIKRVGGRRYKTYRIYQRDLTPQTHPAVPKPPASAVDVQPSSAFAK